MERYEAATHTKVWTDIQQERRAELEQVNQMCELLERELRFMTVDQREQYTVPSLELLERNLEAAMYKVRCEKDRKIGGEINYLENIVRLILLLYAAYSFPPLPAWIDHSSNPY